MQFFFLRLTCEGVPFFFLRPICEWVRLFFSPGTFPSGADVGPLLGVRKTPSQSASRKPHLEGFEMAPLSVLSLCLGFGFSEDSTCLSCGFYPNDLHRS